MDITAMIDQNLFQIACTIVGIFFGWYLKFIDNNIKEQRFAIASLVKELAALNVLVVGEYVKKYDFDKKVDAMFDKLDEIVELLHTKEDRRKPQQ
jgi:hypothetical protein